MNAPIHDTAGVAADYCTVITDTVAALQRVSNALFGPQATYFLNASPDMTRTPDPIEVTIDGAPYPAAGSHGETRWTYSSDLNAVVFSSQTAPGPGSTIGITYAPMCL